MSADENVPPATFDGVMISGTFGDLVEHRKALRFALQRLELVPVDMQNYVTSPSDDVISSSLEMVRKGAAYIGLISHRYGQIPNNPRNPEGHSITRVEFEEAQRLGRPTIIFIMGNEHTGKRTDFEQDAENIEKLVEFRKRAKEGRIYVPFNSLEEFKGEAPLAVAKLKQFLDEWKSEFVGPPAPASEKPEKTIPKPPNFHAEPAYLGSHEFVGRRAELDTLDDWALPSDSHPMLLFEAIGGTGKSMLTWHWVNHCAAAIRDGKDQWAGRFWYSFYERGARLESFCRHALAYMTGQPPEHFDKTKMPQLSERLLAELKAKPWLIVFDGLERILVTYNRSDAAELSDEAAENPEDKIADRDPLAAIRPEDDELLKAMSTATPSKLLITSRLIPRALMNRANQAMPGVLHERLPGLRPADAEEMLRSESCGNITGDSGRIRSFLQQHCDCHPLVIGVLAGLINQPGPWRGDFDAWEKAPDGGGRLNLADLDLIQKRNHILESALAILPEKSRALLATLALLSEAADAELLFALNPHLPPDPSAVSEPEKPEERWEWKFLSDEEKEETRRRYPEELEEWEEYKKAVEKRLASEEFRTAPQRLWKTVKDLEDRGLLQYDAQVRRYDLHPVVRGIVAGRLGPDEVETHGERVVDHFSARSHDPWEEAETLEDVRDGIQVVRTLLRMGRRQAACDAYRGGLAWALFFNLEAHFEVLALLEDFFPDSWDRLPEGLNRGDDSYLSNSAAIALDGIGETDASLAAFGTTLRDDLGHENWTELRTGLSNISGTLVMQNRLAPDHRLRRLVLELAQQFDSNEDTFVARLFLFGSLTDLGNWTEAEALWVELDQMARPSSRAIYRPGDAEYHYAMFCLQRGDLTDDILKKTERLVDKGKNRRTSRDVQALRGEWHLGRGETDLAVRSFEQAVRMARESGLNREALRYETWFTLARVRAGHLAGEETRREAERLSAAVDGSANRPLALLWLEIGDDQEAREAAIRHALAAYTWAWADGEPYVLRYALEETRKILDRLGEPYPDLPPYDPAKDQEFDWEPEVRAVIEKLKKEKEDE